MPLDLRRRGTSNVHDRASHRACARSSSAKIRAEGASHVHCIRGGRGWIIECTGELGPRRWKSKAGGPELCKGSLRHVHRVLSRASLHDNSENRLRAGIQLVEVHVALTRIGVLMPSVAPRGRLRGAPDPEAKGRQGNMYFYE